MKEELEFDIETLKKEIGTGDYYSKDLKTKEIFVLNKKVMDEIRECFEFESDGFGNVNVSNEEKESGILFVMGIIRDIIQDKNYKIIKGKQKIKGENNGK